MSRMYSHGVQGARAIAGHFEPEREDRLVHQGREVVFLLGRALVDTSCCGPTGLRYAVVPGFVLGWHVGTDSDGQPTSEVEPVLALADQRAVSRAIRERYTVSQVVFW